MKAKVHRAAPRARMRLRDRAGQGTVEYVALIMLIAVLLAAVVGAGASAKGVKDIPGKVVTKIENALDTASPQPRHD